jgi:hypothetical protein
MHWGLLQSVYGLVRYFNGSAAFAWLTQAVTTVGLVISVWLVGGALPPEGGDTVGSGAYREPLGICR